MWVHLYIQIGAELRECLKKPELFNTVPVIFLIKLHKINNQKKKKTWDWLTVDRMEVYMFNANIWILGEEYAV